MSGDFFTTFLGAVLLALLSLLFYLPLVACFLYVFYYLLTLPMRRAERARLFLDLLEMGLKDGRSPEAAVIAAASSRDEALGVRFHLLAAYLGEGLPLGAALANVPRLVPTQVQAMIAAGEHVGDLRKVIPACRQLLQDSVSQVRGALNYLLVLTFVVLPATVAIPTIIRVMVLPKYKEVFAGLAEGAQLPAFTRFVFDTQNAFSGLMAGLVLLLWTAVFLYLGGPRVHGWIRRLAPRLVDRLVFLVPWRRKRFQRDFSAMFAVLLDAGLPEAEAVRLAAGATANRVMERRGDLVGNQLQSGRKLTEAIQAMDDTAELRWRLTNALHRRGGFLRAVAGWHESLDAKAFQMEQAAAQVITAALVLVNGVVVAAIVIGMFLPLVDLMNRMSLW